MAETATSETPYDRIDKDAKELKLNLTKEEFAVYAAKQKFSDKDVSNVEELLDYLVKKKDERVAETCLRLSRLPKTNPKTFENFDFDRLHGDNLDQLKSITNMAPLYAHQTIAFIGSQGVGKTHLAIAFGRKCCEHGIKTYFLTASELNEKFTRARKTDRIASAINGLVKPSCLIIDEIGHCTFDLENTRLFFDVINRRTNKNEPHCLILTSNTQPSQWGQFFTEKDTILCTLDRVFDNAIVFLMNGTSYRGQHQITVSLDAQ